MKIDRSLLIDAVSPTGRAILAAMVEPAGELGLTASPRAWRRWSNALLLDVGCQRLQGYLFARPLPAADAAAAALQRLRGHGGYFTDSFFASLELRSGFATTLDGSGPGQHQRQQQQLLNSGSKRSMILCGCGHSWASVIRPNCTPPS